MNLAKLSKKGDGSAKSFGAALALLIAEIKEDLAQDGKSIVKGFGTFKVVKKAEKKGYNPHTGEEMIIPAHETVKFKVSKVLLEKIAKAKEKADE